MRSEVPFGFSRADGPELSRVVLVACKEQISVVAEDYSTSLPVEVHVKSDPSLVVNARHLLLTKDTCQFYEIVL